MAVRDRFSRLVPEISTAIRARDRPRMTVRDLIAALEEMPAEADVAAFTEFTATYGEGVWVHIGKATKQDWGVCLEEEFS